MKNKNSSSNEIISKTPSATFIKGTRITIYDILDYLKAGWPAQLIRNWLDLSEEQIYAAMKYIEENRAEVEAEYNLVQRNTEEIKQYWEEKNRKHFRKSKRKSHKPEIEAKLQEWKSRLKNNGIDPDRS